MPRGEAYDTIGTLFEDFTSTAAQRAIEVRTILHMAGEVTGLSVLDLACGYGFFGRELHSRGAAQIVGVDISAKMIDLAIEESRRNGDPIEFRVGNAADLEKLGEFDLVVAAWLFNYADSPETLGRMFRAAAANLKPTGRLVAYTVEPDFRLADGNFTRYGVNVLTETPWQGGFRHEAEFVTDPPSSFTFYRWSRATYERAIAEAGFSRWQWQKPMLSKEDVDRRPPGFWDVFTTNCLQTGLICRF
ncbi:class I SAM-dependent methyltransferase [Azospirillum thermophilum]|uniref:Class I SAM-dependent methyltransferase n=1 Tax=Azospirillum thermophilum TaxID=2202148 RepID=A0A2S2CXW4_9PROT|nr:class I SAM-dependent methyltransferase [Azospirillum thermophilum]AWK89117.1 class I SAM-dependent methyltransferase [Azospirillum thermophilum]